jgi:hypothetical protein
MTTKLTLTLMDTDTLEIQTTTETETTESEQQGSRVSRHPAIAQIVEWCNNGITRIEGEYVKSAAELCRVLNAKYTDPDVQVKPYHLNRFRKQVKSQTAGYILKDGRVSYQDGTPLAAANPVELLKSFIQVGMEQMLRNPEKIQAKDLVMAMRLLKDINGLKDENEVADAWSHYLNSKGKQRRKKVIDVTPPDAMTPMVIDAVSEDDVEEDE